MKRLVSAEQWEAIGDALTDWIGDRESYQIHVTDIAVDVGIKDEDVEEFADQCLNRLYKGFIPRKRRVKHGR